MQYLRLWKEFCKRLEFKVRFTICRLVLCNISCNRLDLSFTTTYWFLASIFLFRIFCMLTNVCKNSSQMFLVFWRSLLTPSTNTTLREKSIKNTLKRFQPKNPEKSVTVNLIWNSFVLMKKGGALFYQLTINYLGGNRKSSRKLLGIVSTTLIEEIRPILKAIFKLCFFK